MPVELFSSDVGALDFSGPALDSGAVDGRYWFFSQAAPVLTTNNKVDFLSKKTAGKDRKKKTEKTEKRMRTVKYPMMRKSKMMRSEGNIGSIPDIYIHIHTHTYNEISILLSMSYIFI
jgi:hypothetical protein